MIYVLCTEAVKKNWSQKKDEDKFKLSLRTRYVGEKEMDENRTIGNHKKTGGFSLSVPDLQRNKTNINSSRLETSNYNVLITFSRGGASPL